MYQYCHILSDKIYLSNQIQCNFYKKETIVMARVHAEIYYKSGEVRQVAFWNGGNLNVIKQQCMRQARQIFEQDMRMRLEPFRPTSIQIVVDEY